MFLYVCTKWLRWGKSINMSWSPQMLQIANDEWRNSPFIPSKIIRLWFSMTEWYNKNLLQMFVAFLDLCNCKKKRERKEKNSFEWDKDATSNVDRNFIRRSEKSCEWFSLALHEFLRKILIPLWSVGLLLRSDMLMRPTRVEFVLGSQRPGPENPQWLWRTLVRGNYWEKKRRTALGGF